MSPLSPFLARYRADLAFRGRVSLYLGMMLNFAYVLFRAAVGLRLRSIWLLSLAVYHLALGLLRVYLIVGAARGADERRCYRTTAWLLLALNLTVGGLVVQIVRDHASFAYSGPLIYLSAAYAFYALGAAVANILRFRRLGSPILSAAKALNWVAALISVLGLQTALLARFSVGSPAFAERMNLLTGSAVYALVILTAVRMLRRSRAERFRI